MKLKGVSHGCQSDNHKLCFGKTIIASISKGVMGIDKCKCECHRKDTK